HDLQGLGATLYAESTYHLCEGRWEDARRTGERALALIERIANPHELVMVLTILGHAEWCVGDYARSRERSRRMVDTARACANEMHETWGLYTLGRHAIAVGDLDEAVAHLENARGILARLTDAGSNVICHGFLAMAYLRRGELLEARRFADVA